MKTSFTKDDFKLLLSSPGIEKIEAVTPDGETVEIEELVIHQDMSGMQKSIEEKEGKGRIGGMFG